MPPELRVYVGTYTEEILFGTGEVVRGKGAGIHLFRVNPTDGEMVPIDVAEGVKNPSYLCLHPSGRSLYAVNELKTYEGDRSGEGGTVSSFTVDPATGGLSFMNRRPTGGIDPCHVTTDPQGRHVMVANFMSGSISLFPINRDGSLAVSSAFVQHEGSSVDPKRQKGPHAHSSVFDPAARHVFVPDLGLDRVVAYRYSSDSGRLERDVEAGAVLKAGAGPRHMVFSHDARFAYVVNELDSTVSVFGCVAGVGRLEPIESLSTLPADYDGENSSADLHLHPSGRFLYASNRGHDTIAIFDRDPVSGRLRPAGHEPTRGRAPRNFALDPTGRLMLVANRADDSVVAFHIDGETGRLSPTGKTASVGTPVCVKIVSV